MSWLHIFILFPLLAAVIIPILFKKIPRVHTGWFVLVVPLAVFIYLLTFLPMVAGGETAMYSLPWIPRFDIHYSLYVDGLGLVFGLIISGIGALVVLYSIYYLSKHREALHNFYVYLMMFLTAMLGVVFSDNMIVLYLFWELTSISSFLLIAYWYARRQSRYGAQKAMLITIFGGFAMLAAIIMLSIMGETFSLQALMAQSDQLVQHELFLPAMILILIGAFTKSVQFPFHIWLPDAMEAPTPISAYLHSATMVKAGIYLVARFTPFFGGAMEWFWIVTGVGLLTLLWGSLLAVKQRDLKALLAFSTISQLGFIMSLLGMGSAALYYGGGDEAHLHSMAILAAVFHLVNHATFKGSLFMVVGIVDHETGTRDLRKLGGLMSIMPISFTLALIGSLSMAGLPPFNGFLSKELFFTGALNAAELDIFRMETYGALIPIVAWTASIFTFVYSIVLVFKTFFGKYQPERLEKEAHEAPWGMLISPLILTVLVVVIFFVPNVLAHYVLEPMMASILPPLAGEFDIHIEAWHGFEPELFMTIGVVVLGAILYATLRKWIVLYNNMPRALSITNAYNSGLKGMESISRKVTDWHMTGFSRDYLRYILVIFVVITGASLFLLDGFSIDTANAANINGFEIILSLVLVGSTAMVVITRSRLTAVIGVGVLGYIVALFFVVLRAPDLALTQLAIETVTVALFLVCFYHLPRLREKEEGDGINVFNLIIAGAVGLLVTLISLSANGHRLFPAISDFYEDAYELAGAGNMVNAILADFRAIDTLLEIFVLCIAGLAAYALIKLRLARREQDENQ
ncbi:Na+/H+ antiporter subunit A [Natribacillus halophilus]|uniref:Multisubunit sodium/proton antiporter, MrpA subunit n=1 Tax=Natribacillus halophilus TaxID=549003 RepID=A0A1G8QF70_9BACI|nr:Na+/H+ antiporter subunit A [Natribacillus halophilus]SDJ03412.1 multisubunit sodium/proton antiporter, MrpA subunit [Natribacillus halophilus]